MEWLLGGLGIGALGVAAGYGTIRRKGMHRWLGTYAREWSKRRAPEPGKPVHLLLCIADHFEPKRGGAPPHVARERVRRWVDEYPKLFDKFRDSDGRPPRHTFFYPAEEYEPECLDALAGLCRKGFGEVEIHLHHDSDSADNLRNTLMSFKEKLHNKHGLLHRDPATGEIRYGFIHGNWALNNSRRDGRMCGVNNEIDVLLETGCYADFTLPSSPSETQTRKINSIYWATGDAKTPKGHDWGVNVGSGPRPDKSLLMIQGPLLLDWKHRKWGVVPRVENGCIQGNQPPSMHRLDLWLKARIQVPDRPELYFVKLHTHGANDRNRGVLLGDAMVRFHEQLKVRSEKERNFRFSYVTSRDLANVIISGLN